MDFPADIEGALRGVAARFMKKVEDKSEVERLLPDFVNSCRDNADVAITHQDAFAADYQDHEYALLGKAIKFAGLHGKEVRIIGKNRETHRAAAAYTFPVLLIFCDAAHRTRVLWQPSVRVKKP